MKQVNFHYNYPISINIPTNKNVNVFIDKVNNRRLTHNEVRIIILEEPFKGGTYAFIKRRSNYTHVLTFHEEILDANPKAHLFNCVDCWVKNYVFTEKQFSVSTVVGGKTNGLMRGYASRHNLWTWKDLIKTPKAFYVSSKSIWKRVNYDENLVLGDSKAPLFDSMFHVAIENTSIANYFSEKIVDCFQTKTVPIYLGCTNIEKYFNIDGIIRVNNVGDIIEACNSITPELYAKMLPAIEDNYNRSMDWLDHDKQIENAIIKLI